MVASLTSVIFAAGADGDQRIQARRLVVLDALAVADPAHRRRQSGALGGCPDPREAGLSRAGVYLTSYSDDATFARAMATRPCGYLLKPFQDRELQQTIEAALQDHQRESLAGERER